MEIIANAAGLNIPPMNVNRNSLAPAVVTKSMLAEKIGISLDTLRGKYLTDERLYKLGYDPTVDKYKTTFYRGIDKSFFEWLDSLNLDW
jgi:hypothetical protein